MKNETLYNRTVEILVQAYFNDTLEHHNCYACAVGNLIAANCGYGFIKAPRNLFFENGVYTGFGTFYWDRDSSFKDNLVSFLHENNTPQYIYEKSLKQTGYAFKELEMIERAFESCAQGDEEKGDSFNGLMAVIDVLDIIHENTDEAATQETKKRFVKELV